jgi:hypothetical protein
VLHNHHPLISDLELDRYQAEFQQNNPELKITVAFEGLKFEV